MTTNICKSETSIFISYHMYAFFTLRLVYSRHRVHVIVFMTYVIFRTLYENVPQNSVEVSLTALILKVEDDKYPGGWQIQFLRSGYRIRVVYVKQSF